MSTSSRTPTVERNNMFCQILGINFFAGDAKQAVDYMTSRCGLLVVPAAPNLKDLNCNQGYREALLNADLAITDSALMVLTWNWISRDRIPRVSGLAYLRELLNRSDIRTPDATFWIMPTRESADRNARWLRSHGFMLTQDHMYIAPFYRGAIKDPELLGVLRDRRPRHVIVAIGGGTQEPLGLYLKSHLDYPLSIHCIGAAIAFLSGDQVNIPVWADRLYLGWLFRSISDPQKYLSRYWSARKLIPLMIRYRARIPIQKPQVSPVATVTNPRAPTDSQ
jgi:UDP-N-acetyl-D-mannosaminuronic acid transferase (WecB/TagA/CpsF family)